MNNLPKTRWAAGRKIALIGLGKHRNEPSTARLLTNGV